MLKRVFFILFLFSSFLYASNNDIMQLQTLFFKAGLDSMVKEFESEKNVTREQQKMIDFLHSKVYSHEITLDKLSKFFKNNKNELELEKSFFPEDKNSKSIQEIQLQLVKLQEELSYYKQYINKHIANVKIDKENSLEKVRIFNKNSSKGFSCIINTKSVNLREEPKINSKVGITMMANQKIQLEYCDKYGWCKLKAEELFIAKHLLKCIK